MVNLGIVKHTHFSYAQHTLCPRTHHAHLKHSLLVQPSLTTHTLRALIIHYASIFFAHTAQALITQSIRTLITDTARIVTTLSVHRLTAQAIH